MVNTNSYNEYTNNRFKTHKMVTLNPTIQVNTLLSNAFYIAPLSTENISYKQTVETSPLNLNIDLLDRSVKNSKDYYTVLKSPGIEILDTKQQYTVIKQSLDELLKLIEKPNTTKKEKRSIIKTLYHRDFAQIRKTPKEPQQDLLNKLAELA